MQLRKRAKAMHNALKIQEPEGNEFTDPHFEANQLSPGACRRNRSVSLALKTTGKGLLRSDRVL
eukprot:4639861-Amphidinium_carterae.1